jgi:hypothetical protein
MNKTTRRTDRVLIGILDETAAWAVRGEKGAVLAQAASLRDVLAMAADIEREGQRIAAVTEGRDDRVIVFRAQMDRLLEAMGG